MEEEELKEITEKEMQRAKNIVEKMLRENRMNEIELLYRDRFNIKKRNACYEKSIPVNFLIPIYQTVIVPISPFASENSFEDVNGCKVDQLLEWRKKGWVETVLTNPPVDYTSLDYLDDLIGYSPSAAVRNSLYCAGLVGGSDAFNNLWEEARNVFKGRIILPRSWIDVYGTENVEETYKATIASNYADLSVFGFKGIIERIRELSKSKSKQDLRNSGALAFNSALFLIDPFLRALKKTMVYPSNLRSTASIFWNIMKPTSSTLFAPFWLADVYENLGVSISPDIDTDQIEAVRKNSGGFVKAVKSLDEEIDRNMRERFEGGELHRNEKELITAKKEKLRKRWYDDIKPSLESIETRKEKIGITLTSSIVAPAVALSAFSDVLSLPQTLIVALASSRKIKELVDPTAEYLAKWWEFNPIHIGFYEVNRDLKKLKK